MSRLGRSQPVPPFSTHGFVGNVPANFTTPTPTVVVENDDRRRKQPLLQPLVVSGALASFVTAPAANPPGPFNVDRADQRHRYRPLDPLIISGALAALFVAPAVNPPAPFVVPLDERKRFLAQLPPGFTKGFDDVTPPEPNVVEPAPRRRLPLDPYTLRGPAPPPQVNPPAPLILDRVDQRVRYRPLDPTIWNGLMSTVPVIVQATAPGYFTNTPAGQTGSSPTEGGYATAPAGFTGNTPTEGDFDAPRPRGQ